MLNVLGKIEGKAKKSLKQEKSFLFLKFCKARPNQAGFIIRFLAFSIDSIIITLIAIVFFQALSQGVIYVSGGETKFAEPKVESDYSFQELQEEFSSEDFNKIKSILQRYDKKFLLVSEGEEKRSADISTVRAEIWDIFREFIVAYIYFILFFRFGGRTPGKRTFHLQVVDLKGGKRLKWYQAFERTHGYTASALMAGIGFLQVLWDTSGLTMHDKIAGITVVRLQKKKK
jgi:uncharacterized RDD family membrane protein YckC